VSRRYLGTGLAVAAAAIVIDQASKYAILDHYGVAGECRRVLEPVILTPFLNLILTCNTGVSFGLFPAGSPAMIWVLAGVALVIAGGLLVWLWRINRMFPALAIGLVIGGALGNVIDRIRYDSVVDFIDFHVSGWHFATFNAADSAISVGVALLLLDSLFGPRESPK
jgi:signal peptidase II